MRYARYAKLLRKRKEQHAYGRKRPTWRPADYEPDFDGPTRDDSTEGPSRRTAWHTEK